MQKTLHTYNAKNTARMLTLLALIFIAASCEKTGHQHTEEEKITYTCPMHPQVVQNTPGKCPVCGMDLVKAEERDSASGDLMLSDTQMKLANITTRKVSVKNQANTLTINGRLAINEERVTVAGSRASGRIERLFFRETGRIVKKGEPLYSLYSEQLLTLQQEYLLTKKEYETSNRDVRYKSFIDAAERKLLLYGLTQEQISALAGSQTAPSPLITFQSPTAGVIIEVNGTESSYVQEGAPLYRIADISTLWVNGELYPADVDKVQPGTKVAVRVPGLQDPIQTVVDFISPQLKTNSQITAVRATIKNPGLKLQPGQLAYIDVIEDRAAGISVPADAVVRNEKGSHVYLQRGRNTFRPQAVTTGSESFEYIEITSGLSPDDTIAVTGAYLLYSEIVLKKGSDPMQGHIH